MNDRQTEIVEATNECLRNTANWVRDIRRGEPMVPSQIVMAHCENMIVVAASGDVPQSCTELAMKISRFGEEFRQYQRGVDGKVQPNGAPTAPFWGAFVAVEEHVIKATHVYVEQLESIKELREQKVSDAQIALIYGRSRGMGKFEGPFFVNGLASKRLIDQAAKGQGEQNEILRMAGWPEMDGVFYPPWQKQSGTVMQEANKARMEMWKKLSEGPKQNSDPRSVEDMILDGCFIHQIEQYKGVSRADILQVAASIGVEVKDAPGMHGGHRVLPKPIAAADQVELQQRMDQSLLKPNIEPEAVTSPKGLDHLTQQAIEAIVNGNPEFGAAEVVADLSQDGIVAEVRAVSGYMRQLKNRARKAS